MLHENFYPANLGNMPWSSSPPAAQAIKFLTANFNDITPDGFAQMVCTGKRWIDPSRSLLIAPLLFTSIQVLQASSNDTTPSKLSLSKVRIPTSAENGSLMRNGDKLVFTYSGTRGSSTSATMRRTITAGTHATDLLQNTELTPEVPVTTTNNGVAESFVVQRLSATTLIMPGRTVIGAFAGEQSGAVTTPVGVTVPNMDNSDIYIDFSMVWANNNTETFTLENLEVRLLQLGEA